MGSENGSDAGSNIRSVWVSRSDSERQQAQNGLNEIIPSGSNESGNAAGYMKERREREIFQKERGVG